MSRSGQKKKKTIEHWQLIVIFLVLYDTVAVNLAYFLALWFRFDCVFSRIPRDYLMAWRQFAPIYTLLCIVLFAIARLYNSLWRFASFSELIRITIASLTASVLHVVLITALFRRMPISYDIIGAGF